MVTTGVIKSVSSGTTVTYTVEIPKYELVVEVEGEKDLPSLITTNSSEESSVKTSVSPGIVPIYKENDVVFVCIEDNVLDKVVIMGLSSRPNKDTDIPAANITADVLKVLSEATLPADTTIGEVTKENIATLKGMKENIAAKFQQIEDERNSLFESLITMFDKYFNEE